MFHFARCLLMFSKKCKKVSWNEKLMFVFFTNLFLNFFLADKILHPGERKIKTEKEPFVLLSSTRAIKHRQKRIVFICNLDTLWFYL